MVVRTGLSEQCDPRGERRPTSSRASFRTRRSSVGGTRRNASASRTSQKQRRVSFEPPYLRGAPTVRAYRIMRPRRARLNSLCQGEFNWVGGVVDAGCGAPRGRLERSINGNGQVQPLRYCPLLHVSGHPSSERDAQAMISAVSTRLHATHGSACLAASSEDDS